MFGEQILVYTRSSRRWEEGTTRGVGWFPHLYTMFDDMGERTDAFECFVTEEVETPAAPALRKAAATPETLTAGEREAIAMFMGVTIARTPAMLATGRQGYFEGLPADEVHDLDKLARLWAAYVGLPKDKDVRTEFMKPSAFGAILVWAASFRDRVTRWDWHFVRTTRDAPFATSDWPVYAERDRVHGIYFVQFPISAEIALVANSAGELRQERDPKEDVRATNRGTLQRACEFAVSCCASFPGDGYLSEWSERCAGP